MFNLTQYTKVYVPSFSNSVREIAFLGKNNGYPIHIVDEHLTVTSDGKNFPHDDNPIVFPYSQEWYDKLKLAYPNLEPYKDEYNELLNLLEQQVDSVACRVSRTSYEEACKNGYVVFKNTAFEGSFTYFVPVNPYTLEPCKTVEDYFKVPSSKMPF